jgi:hypothetical protein
VKALDIFLEGEEPVIKRKKSLILEANIAKKILADPKKTKMMAIAIRHDWSFPKHAIAKLGDRATDQQIVDTWGKLIDQALSNTGYGNLSQDGTFDDWIAQLYITGGTDYEEIVGETGDAMGLWKKLSHMVKRTPDRPDPNNPNRTIFGNAILDANGNTQPVLKPKHSQLKNFKTAGDLRHAMRDPDYQDIFKKLQDAAKLEKLRAESDMVVLINDDEFYVVAMFNYGATFTFARGMGVFGEYCTGFDGSSGLSYSKRYMDQGLLVGIIHKQTADQKNGKFQMLAADGQLRNAPQNPSGQRQSDELFAETYPGVMKKIAAAIQEHGEEIVQHSKERYLGGGGGYDIAREVSLIQRQFPLSWASEPPAPAEPGADGNPQHQPDHQPVPGRD